jgi:hypothetical protein
VSPQALVCIPFYLYVPDNKLFFADIMQLLNSDAETDPETAAEPVAEVVVSSHVQPITSAKKSPKRASATTCTPKKTPVNVVTRLSEAAPHTTGQGLSTYYCFAIYCNMSIAIPLFCDLMYCT